MWADDDEDALDDALQLQQEMLDEQAMEQQHLEQMEQMEQMVPDEDPPEVAGRPGTDGRNTDNGALAPAIDVDRPVIHYAPPLQSSFATKEFASKTALSKRKVAAGTESMADRLHLERKALYGDALHQSSSIHQMFDEAIELVTQQPVVHKCKDAKRFLHELPAQKPFTITLTNQRRFYLQSSADLLESSADSLSGARLLSKSIAQLQAEVDDLTLQRMQRDQRRQASRAQPATGNKSKTDFALWVDKYAPRGFVQLLSPERTNRSVLMAVKKWDKFVFKRESVPIGASATGKPQDESLASDPADPRPFHKIILLAGPPGTGKTTLAHIVARMCGYHAIEVNASDDRSGEHLQEVLVQAMTHNAPGFDTEASGRPHCVIFDEVDGMDNNKVYIEKILDMIKAPLLRGGGHEALAAAAAAGEVGDGDGSEDEGTDVAPRRGKTAPRGRPARTSALPITRPVLLICNNLYAPALAQIKRHADVFLFSSSGGQSALLRVQQKLRHILQAEGLASHPVNTPGALNELVIKANFDIRSAINALQFLTLTAGGAADGPLLRKDLAPDSMLLLQHAFKQVPASVSSSGTAARPADMAALLDAFVHFGDPQHLVAGLFENLPLLFSSHIHKLVPLYHWFVDMDVLGQHFSSGMHLFESAQYQALLAGVILTCYSAQAPARVQWPRKDKDAHFRQQQKRGLACALAQAPAAVQQRPSPQRLVLEIGSALLGMLDPPVRALPFSSMGAAEQRRVCDVAALLNHAGLSLVPDRSLPFLAAFPRDGDKRFKPAAQQPLVLEPNLRLLCTFHLPPAPSSSAPGAAAGAVYASAARIEGEELATRPAPRRELQEVIAAQLHRVAIESKALRAKEKLEQRGVLNPGPVAQSVTRAAPAAPAPIAAAVTTPSRAVPTAPVVPADVLAAAAGQSRKIGGGISSFFQRPAGSDSKRPAPTSEPCPSAVPAGLLSGGSAGSGSGLRFKFYQGYSNAVKRPVRVVDFLKGFQAAP